MPALNPNIGEESETLSRWCTSRTNRVNFGKGAPIDSDLFLDLLENLRRTYRHARWLVLIVDNYIIHKGRLASA